MRVSIDRNYLDVGTGQPAPCDAVSLNLTAYPTLRAGVTGNAVEVVQCLLAAEPTGTLDDPSVAAVQAFQQSRGLPATGVLDSRTWTALLSKGDGPVLRQGAAGTAVSRLQRALTAALGRTVGIDGQFGPNTDQAVRDYQRTRGSAVDGVVGQATWTALQAGR